MSTLGFQDIAIKTIDEFNEKIEEFMATLEFETIEYVAFQKWVEMVTVWQELIEDFDERFSSNSTTIQTRIDEIELNVRTNLAKLFRRPTIVGRTILTQLFNYENPEETDDVIRFIEDTSDDSDDENDENGDDDGEPDDEVNGTSPEVDEENVNGTTNPQIFDKNTMIYISI